MFTSDGTVEIATLRLFALYGDKAWSYHDLELHPDAVDQCADAAASAGLVYERYPARVCKDGWGFNDAKDGVDYIKRIADQHDRYDGGRHVTIPVSIPSLPNPKS